MYTTHLWWRVEGARNDVLQITRWDVIVDVVLCLFCFFFFCFLFFLFFYIKKNRITVWSPCSLITNAADRGRLVRWSRRRPNSSYWSAAEVLLKGRVRARSLRVRARAPRTANAVSYGSGRTHVRRVEQGGNTPISAVRFFLCPRHPPKPCRRRPSVPSAAHLFASVRTRTTVSCEQGRWIRHRIWAHPYTVSETLGSCDVGGGVTCSGYTCTCADGVGRPTHHRSAQCP
jgi:hypothetical protein